MEQDYFVSETKKKEGIFRYAHLILLFLINILTKAAVIC